MPTPETATDLIHHRWIRLAPAIGALLAAMLVSSQIQLSMMDHGHDWWRIFVWQLSGWGFGAVLAPRMLRVGVWVLRPESRPRFWLVREALVAFAGVVAHLFLTACVFVMLQPYRPVAIDSFGAAGLRSLYSWPHIDAMVYAIGVTIGYGLEAYQQARLAELRHSRLETELARTQLETLRLQIQPHFLFNSLNSIAALMRRKKNDRALDMLIGLSSLLRATLERAAHLQHPLREEVDFLRLYLDLQQVRFADRLSVEWQIEEELLDQLLPSLLLQPLVENAIRHGIAPRAAPGRLTIRAEAFKSGMLLVILDDGVGLMAGFDLDKDSGVGLSNTRSRLIRIYGETARLTVSQRAMGGTRVEIWLPFESQVEARRIDRSGSPEAKKAVAG